MDFTKIVEQSKNFFATYIAQVNTISFTLGSYLEDQIASTVLMFIGACVLYFVPVSYTHLTLPTNSRV